MGCRGRETNATRQVCIDYASLGDHSVRFVSYSKSTEEPGDKGKYEGHSGCFIRNSLKGDHNHSREPKKELKGEVV